MYCAMNHPSVCVFVVVCSLLHSAAIWHLLQVHQCWLSCYRYNCYNAIVLSVHVNKTNFSLRLYTNLVVVVVSVHTGLVEAWLRIFILLLTSSKTDSYRK